MSTNLNSHDFHLLEEFEDDLFRRAATVVSLSRNYESEDEEDLDDEIQTALAQSLAEHEEQVARAAAEAFQEEEDMMKAVIESQSFQEEREMRDQFIVFEQANEAWLRQQGDHEELTDEFMTALPIEAQEQMLEWLQNTPDVETDFPAFGDSEGEELPVLYKNYRLVPTVFVDSEMWPPSAIQRQLTELQLNRGSEDIMEWQNTQSENDRCLVCLTNVATRVAVPCGHRLSCRPCISSLVRQDNYYAVTAADGQTVLTDRRLPILCCTCRSIVGQIVTIH